MFQWDNKEHTSFTGSFRDPETNTYKKITFNSKDTNPYINSVFGRHSYFEVNGHLIECDLTKYSEQEQMEYLINRLDNEVKYTIDYGITYIGNDLYPINDKFLNELAAKANLDEAELLGVTGHKHKVTNEQIKYFIKCITYVRDKIHEGYFKCMNAMYEVPRELRQGIKLNATTFNIPVYCYKRNI